MDLLASYGEDVEGGSGDEGPSTSAGVAPSAGLQLAVTAAPEVPTEGLKLHNQQLVPEGVARHLQDPKLKKTLYNLPLETMHAPIQGPAHPYNKDGLAAGHRNHRAGHVEDAHMSLFSFMEQYTQFNTKGYAHAPGSLEVVGDVERHAQDSGAVARGGGAAGGGGGGGGGEAPLPGIKRRLTHAELLAAEARSKAAKKDRQQQAGQQAAEQQRQLLLQEEQQPYTLVNRAPWASKEVKLPDLTEEQKAYIAQKEQAKQEAAADSVETKGPVSFFHGKEKEDYQGRSWLDAPKDKRKENDVCFLPKRWIHTWAGHSKGVNAIRFFPQTGHLLLSAGMDGKVKIWDVNNGGKCMRTYVGHSKGVRDITFSNDGRRFVSTGYDKNIRLWDTETGQVLQTFNTGKLYYCVTLHPEKQGTLMAGANDKKIYQWDMDSGDLVQEYNYHLGPVNTVTFLDPPSGTRFVTTSDDKTIRMWEFGIPVQIKYLADPSMHAISACALSPNHNIWIGQSQDNQIVTYKCSKGEKFRQERNKCFKGHNTAGYACAVGFSPDGKHVMSGDSEGRAFFWKYGDAHKVQRTIKAHDGVCIGVAWHPLEISKVATCGWDGLIKYWD